LKSAGNYECRFGRCRRAFGNLHAFRKHLHSKHPPCRVRAARGNVVEIPPVENAVPVVDADDVDNVAPADANEDNPEGLVTVTLDEFKERVEGEVAALVAKWHSRAGFPRNHVQHCVEDISSFLTAGFLGVMQHKAIAALRATGASAEVIQDYENMHSVIEHAFDPFSSESKRFKYFERCDAFVRPEKVHIGDRRELNHIDGVNRVSCESQFIPLRKTLEKFFQLPDALTATLENLQSLQDDTENHSFVHSEVWKKIRGRYPEDKTVIPLKLTYDDFETNNPLGPHSLKIGGTYVAVVGLPSELEATLQNIFLCLLFESADREYFGNTQVFRPLLYELQFLEDEGIVIEPSGFGPTRVYFPVMFVGGDNLGIHQICGLTKSFSANYPCRFCKMRKTDTERAIFEEEALLRDNENYSQDVAANDVSSTGVHERCIWDVLRSFQLVDNWFCDSLHDLLEGVCHYTMLYVLHHIIYVANFFSVETLNTRRKCFPYCHIRNKPTKLKSDFYKKEKLPLTASEMLCFVRIFGALVGDLVPKGDPVWNLYLKLKDIVDFVMSKTFPKSCSNSLKTLVAEHHQIYLELTGETLKRHSLIRLVHFPKVLEKFGLKPKHHYLTHYPRLIEKCGPVLDLWTMRSEARHRPFKSTASGTTSRVNICHTLALQNQLTFCERILSNLSVLPQTKFGPGYESELHPHINGYDFNFISQDLLQEDKCLLVNWINVKGTEYKPGMTLYIDASDMHPIFGDIDRICVVGNELFFFVVSCLEVLKFEEHLRAFQVRQMPNEKRLVLQSDLIDYKPLISFRNGKGIYVLTNSMF